jgi:hypothetical protein
VAGHGAHRFEDARIPNPTRRDLELDHVVPLLLHGISRTLAASRVEDAHCRERGGHRRSP